MWLSWSTQSNGGKAKRQACPDTLIFPHRCTFTVRCTQQLSRAEIFILCRLADILGKHKLFRHKAIPQRAGKRIMARPAAYTHVPKAADKLVRGSTVAARHIRYKVTLTDITVHGSTLGSASASTGSTRRTWLSLKARPGPLEHGSHSKSAHTRC